MFLWLQNENTIIKIISLQLLFFRGVGQSYHIQALQRQKLLFGK